MSGRYCFVHYKFWEEHPVGDDCLDVIDVGNQTHPRRDYQGQASAFLIAAQAISVFATTSREAGRAADELTAVLREEPE
jgi:hypothetical protein